MQLGGILFRLVVITFFASDDTMYLERLLQAKELKTHKHFQAPKQRNGTFIVHHYADSVIYTVDEFCEKNKDLLVSDVVAMMQVRSENTQYTHASYCD